MQQDRTWEETVIIRRLKLGWNKSELAEKVGVSRAWMWRGIEANIREAEPLHPLRIELDQALKDRIDAVLDKALTEMRKENARLAETAAA